jgi:short-subunit dehydrogenase
MNLAAMYMPAGSQIVNVCSGQVFFKLPNWGIYTATKVALSTLSELLHYELKNKNINVLTVYPFMVNTGFYNNKEEKPTFLSEMAMDLLPYYSDTPKKVAKKIVKAIEKRQQREMVNPINYIGMLTRLPIVSSIYTSIATKLLVKGA